MKSADSLNGMPAPGQIARTLVLVALACEVAGGLVWGQSAKKAHNAGPRDDLKEAQKLADAGDRAMAAGKMQEGVTDYEAAVKAAPGDMGIARRAASARAHVVQELVDRAEAYALDGHVISATALMYEALKIDPSNAIVAERLAQMKQMPKEYLPAGDKEDYALQGSPKLRAEAGKKNINVRGDSKSAYEQVAGMYGIKVAFDPDLTARNVKLRIDGVDFDMAMQLLGASSQSFYRVVNPTLIFVAADTIAKRKEYSEEIEQTFRLDESVGPEEITEMTRVLREITNSTRITTNTTSHSLTLRETADKVALAGQLIKELEQSRRDVMLDIDLLEVDRNAARKLGVTPPSSVQAIPLNASAIAQLQKATNITNLLTILGQIFTAQGISASPT